MRSARQLKQEYTFRELQQIARDQGVTVYGKTKDALARAISPSKIDEP